jgi:ADP-ribosyl-[dinitrogen reductase] hydrolase
MLLVYLSRSIFVLLFFTYCCAARFSTIKSNPLPESDSQNRNLTTMNKMELVRNSLKGLYVFDAVASPTHWFYDRNALKATYGTIQGYVKPCERMRGSIMSLSNTGGGGRGSDKGSIVGDVILHGKKKYWGRGADYHYHVTLEQGENTLEGSLVRLMVRTLSSSTDTSTSLTSELHTFRENYVNFMTTADTHNDSYASTCHRMFFANRQNGLELDQCPDNDNHNVDSMDALTLAIPVILQLYAKGENDDNFIANAALQTIRVTRNVSVNFELYSNAFSFLLLNVLKGHDVRSSVEIAADMSLGSGAGTHLRQMVSNGDRDDPMVACYIDSSFPAMLFMLYKYADKDIGTVALANANAGGENVARGSALGAVLGARAEPLGRVNNWCETGLYHKDEINAEIDNFIAKLSSTL